MGTVAEDPGPGNAELSSLLRGFRQTGAFNAVALCPCHDDKDPSLTITVRRKIAGEGPLTAMIYCPVCGANGVDTARALGVKPGTLLYADFSSFGKRRTGPAPLPSPGDVRQRRRAMTGEVATAFYAWRGIGWRTRRAFDVGWNAERQRYELPIRASKDGPLVSLKWCKLRYEGQDRKGLRILGGHTIRLYPYPPPADERWVLLTEGEWDCLRARQVGLPAYTAGGAGYWSPLWSPLFRGKNVVVIYDCDDGGRNGAQKVQRLLTPYVDSVTVVDLDPARDDKYDLSDFLSRNSRAHLMERVVGQTTLGKKQASGRRRRSV